MIAQSVRNLRAILEPDSEVYEADLGVDRAASGDRLGTGTFSAASHLSPSRKC